MRPKNLPYGRGNGEEELLVTTNLIWDGLEGWGKTRMCLHSFAETIRTGKCQITVTGLSMRRGVVTLAESRPDASGVTVRSSEIVVWQGPRVQQGW